MSDGKSRYIPANILKLDLLTRRFLKGEYSGGYKSIFRGTGLEFDGYRNYTSGDDASRIDWNASARVNQVVLKEYIEERNLSVVFLLDASASMFFGTTGTTKYGYACDFVESLCYSILGAGDEVGIAIYDDKLRKYLVPRGGNLQQYVIGDVLRGIEPASNSRFNYAGGLKHIISVRRTPCIIFVVSDFNSVDMGGFDNITMRIAEKRHELIGFMLKDPVDKKLPEGNYVLRVSDPVSGEQSIIDMDSVRADYEKNAHARDEWLKKKFLETNTDLAELDTSKNFFPTLFSFFKMVEKRRSQQSK